jgi:AraC-like DNA-binding protein
MEPDETNPIRREWMFDVRSACQSFVCRTWSADRTEFKLALRWFSGAVPASETIQELDALDGLMKFSALDAAATFHRESHERLDRHACQGFTVESTLRAWAAGGADPCGRFAHWTGVFVTAFDSTHPALPCERAAAIVRSRFRTPPRRGELAAEVGLSKSALNRDFNKRYGMPIGEFSTRLKLGWFVEAVRSSRRSCTELAVEAGYGSYHNLSGALKHRTRLTPEQLRTLDAEALLDVHRKLALHLP